jgi:hypothetical protein
LRNKGIGFGKRDWGKMEPDEGKKAGSKAASQMDYP